MKSSDIVTLFETKNSLFSAVDDTVGVKSSVTHVGRVREIRINLTTNRVDYRVEYEKMGTYKRRWFNSSQCFPASPPEPTAAEIQEWNEEHCQ